MSKSLFLECYSGISGDMAVAALIDLGADKEVLLKALETIPAQGYKVNISRVKKNGLDACDFDVILDQAHENHDHDMEYLYGENKPEISKHHYHEHRNLSDVIEIINKTNITKHAKEVATTIFTILANAEAKAHGTDIEHVHFHEVGAIDSIVDIIAFSVCFDQLELQNVIVTNLYEGRGTIRCQHGILPVPVPAVANIVSEYKLPLHITATQGELVTPTGAAIVAAIKTNNKLPDSYTIEAIGLGAGKRTYDTPSLVRAMIINETGTTDLIYKLETNIDDSTGEMLGFLMEQLLENGARDVYYTPVYMKKNRPSYVLTVICKEDKTEELETLIFKETTTIGIRRVPMKRTVLGRTIRKVHTTLGDALVKYCRISDEIRCYPEYESVKELCKKHKLAFMEVYYLVQKEAKEGTKEWSTEKK